MDDDELAVRLRNDRYPRSAGYSARWLVDAAMGPNPLWQAEALADFEPDENLVRIAEAGLEDRVHPVFAEAHALPYAGGFFDAFDSIGAYHYFGTDDLYLGYCANFVKPGGQLGIVQPGPTEEYEELPPPHLESYWKWDFCAWHSAAWWRRHWEKTGLVTVEHADRLPHSWQDWLQWNEACDLANGMPGREEARMLHADGGRTLGLTRVVARRKAESSREEVTG
ncbi:SAM-dependent methyltransferase [Kribbella sp. HUAS MG21]|uniref:SAM-dependent methyltransferase n=1 Tax=Kribbella sp. HUAS MG21 TaxID=3160966 RepID=A0AAU7TJM4_9ACTN